MPNREANARVVALLSIVVTTLDTAVQYTNNAAQIMVMDDSETVIELQHIASRIAKARRRVNTIIERKQRGY